MAGLVAVVAIVRAREGSSAPARTAPTTTARPVAAKPPRSPEERALDRFAALPAAVVRGAPGGASWR